MAETLNTNPVISVIVPCYNQAVYLSDALQSVLEQDYPYWECIIINDGSPDNTDEIARQWVEKDNRFRYFYKNNSGVADTRNYGVSQASGEYILPLDGDDKLGTAYFSEAIQAFSEDSDIKLVYSNTILFGDKNEKIVNKEFVFGSMMTENQIHNSAIFRRADFLAAGGYNPNMVNGIEDWDFYLSLLRPTDKVIKLSGFHYYYRIKAISRSSSINTHKEKNDAMLLQMFRNHVPLFLEYFNPIRDHIEADYYKREVDSYRNSAEYKTGKVIYFPVRFIQKVFLKLFRWKKD